MPLLESCPLDKCYWCDKKLLPDDQTRDHFFSAFIRREFNFANKTLFCISCSSCNLFRGSVSELFTVLWCQKQNAWHNACLDHIPNESQIASRANKLLRKNKDLWHFREKVAAILSGGGKQVCLLEIDTVILYYAKKSKHQQLALVN